MNVLLNIRSFSYDLFMPEFPGLVWRPVTIISILNTAEGIRRSTVRWIERYYFSPTKASEYVSYVGFGEIIFFLYSKKSLVCLIQVSAVIVSVSSFHMVNYATGEIQAEETPTFT